MAVRVAEVRGSSDALNLGGWAMVGASVICASASACWSPGADVRLATAAAIVEDASLAA